MSDILVVDDNPAFRKMLGTALRAAGHSVRLPATAEEAWGELQRRPPDAMVLEVHLKGMDGFALCRRMKEEKALQEVPVVFLSAGLEPGADDTLVKPFSLPELLARIRLALRKAGKIQDGEDRLSSGPLTADIGEKLATLDGKPLSLTPKEFQLLCLFLRCKRRALSRAAISREVWGKELKGASRTIDAHVTHLRRKLGGLRKCLQTVESTGYRWMDPA